MDCHALIHDGDALRLQQRLNVRLLEACHALFACDRSPNQAFGQLSSARTALEARRRREEKRQEEAELLGETGKVEVAQHSSRTRCPSHHASLHSKQLKKQDLEIDRGLESAPPAIPVGSWRDARATNALRDERGGCFPFGKREAKLTEIERTERPRQASGVAGS